MRIYAWNISIAVGIVPSAFMGFRYRNFTDMIHGYWDGKGVEIVNPRFQDGLLGSNPNQTWVHGYPMFDPWLDDASGGSISPEGPWFQSRVGFINSHGSIFHPSTVPDLQSLIRGFNNIHMNSHGYSCSILSIIAINNPPPVISGFYSSRANCNFSNYHVFTF